MAKIETLIRLGLAFLLKIKKRVPLISDDPTTSGPWPVTRSNISDGL